MSVVCTHVIPIGGNEPIHKASPFCHCNPTRDIEAPLLWIHNAFDCREKFERQGLVNKDLPWATVHAEH